MSGAFKPEDPTIATGIWSNSSFGRAFGNQVNYFDAKTTKIVVLNNAVLTGLQCSKSRLWRVPLVEHPMNVDVDTILLDNPTKLENLNSLYDVQTNIAATQELVRSLLGQTTNKMTILA